MQKQQLTILRCPITHKRMSFANREIVARVNEAIDAGTLSNRDGQVISTTWSDALITDDEKLLYGIRDGIPVLIEGESVRMDQLE